MWISKTNHMNGTKTKSTVSSLTNSDETTFILAQLLRVHLPLKLSQNLFLHKVVKKKYIFLCFYKLHKKGLARQHFAKMLYKSTFSLTEVCNT